MNQILSTGDDAGKGRKDLKPEKEKRIKEPKEPKMKTQKTKNVVGIKKVAIFFACSILIFGLVLIGSNIYNINTRLANAKVPPPVLEIGRFENSATIRAEYQRGIQKIVYYWNEEEINSNVQAGREFFTTSIEIPNGEGRLTVQLVDMNGDVILETAQDFIAIGINLLEEEGEIQVLASYIHGLSYIRYRINDEEEIIIEKDELNPGSIEAILNIAELGLERGTNTLTVTAVSENGLERTATQTIQGRYDPEIRVIRNVPYELEVIIEHPLGFERIELELNGRIIVFDSSSPGYEPDMTRFESPIPLAEGSNSIRITAYSKEGTSSVFSVTNVER